MIEHQQAQLHSPLSGAAIAGWPNSQAPAPDTYERTATAAMYAALAKASGEFAAIAKNRTVKIPTKSGGSYAFRYADLEAVIAATRPALSKNGLTVLQPLMQNDKSVTLTTMLVHANGGMLKSSMPVPGIEGKDPKEYGALITYLRRYMLTALLGVAADDDLDDQPPGGNRSLSAEDMAGLLDSIAAAANPGELRTAFDHAVEVATRAADSDAVKRLTAARDARMKAAKKEAANAPA